MSRLYPTNMYLIQLDELEIRRISYLKLYTLSSLRAALDYIRIINTCNSNR